MFISHQRVVDGRGPQIEGILRQLQPANSECGGPASPPPTSQYSAKSGMQVAEISMDTKSTSHDVPSGAAASPFTSCKHAAVPGARCLALTHSPGPGAFPPRQARQTWFAGQWAQMQATWVAGPLSRVPQPVGCGQPHRLERPRQGGGA